MIERIAMLEYREYCQALRPQSVVIETLHIVALSQVKGMVKTERSLLIDLNGVIISSFILNCAICIHTKNLHLL